MKLKDYIAKAIGEAEKGGVSEVFFSLKVDSNMDVRDDAPHTIKFRVAKKRRLF